MIELNLKPEWVIFISDNGPHYYNADLMMIMRKWKEWYDIDVRKWTFLEAGEAKTSIDSHHAQVKEDFFLFHHIQPIYLYYFNILQISHAIKLHVRLGFDISQGSDIESAIEGICGTSVAHLEPECAKGKKKKWINQKIGYTVILKSVIISFR